MYCNGINTTFGLKNVYILNTYNNVFLHLKICYLKYDTKYIFCIRSTLNIYFYKIYFLNYNFYIIWNNNSWNIIPYKPQFSLCKNGQEKKIDCTHFTSHWNIHHINAIENYIISLLPILVYIISLYYPQNKTKQKII